MRFLLDTNVISETRRKRPDAGVLAWLRQVDPTELYVSVLTLREIAKGALARRDPAGAAALRRWLDGLRRDYVERLVGIDAEIAEAWGRLSAIRLLPVIDGLLIATAEARGMTLVTRNVRDTAGSGISVIDPWVT